MQFEFVNPDAVKHTGFSGWLNTRTGKVLLCSRMDHLRLLEKGFLDGIEEGSVYDLESEGGAGSGGWMEIRRWAATKGWVHFVTNDEATQLFFVASSTEQETVCRAFATDAGIPASFKGTGAYS